MQKANQPVSPLFIPKLIFVTLCMFIGFFGFFVSVWKDNYFSAPFYLILEMVSIASIQMNVMYQKGKLFAQQAVKIRLNMNLYIAVFMWGITLAGGIYFLVNAVQDKQDFQVEGEGYYFGAIGCGLGVICSMILIFESRKFLGLLAQEGVNPAYSLN